MKVFSVLLCFALAHGINGSIFLRHNHHRDNLDVRHRDDLDVRHQDYTSQHLNQQTRGPLKDHHLGSNKHNEQQENYHGQQSQSQQWDQIQSSSGEHQPPQPHQYQNPIQHINYQSSSAQQSQEQDKSSWQPLWQQEWTPHYSSSGESNQNNYETQENRNSYNNLKSTSRPGSQNWESSQHSSDQEKNISASSETVQWKGLNTFVGAHIPHLYTTNIEKIFREAQNAIKHFSEEEKMKFHEAFDLAQQQNEDAELNATQLVQKYQYLVEEHRVKTDDGYVLTVFRIPPKKHTRDVQKRQVVFLMHGILGSADDWLLMGPQKSLAYMLSDAGYDVWLGNARGNKYSQNHVSKNPAISDFWQYSADEIALHDLPAMIDYALHTTNQEKLYYIGHSLGTTTFFALTATRPEYNDKIIMMYALSPVVYMTNVRSPLIRMIAPISNFFQILLQQFGNGAFTPSKELIHTLGGTLLEKITGSKKVASHINFVMAGFHAEDQDIDTISVVMHHLPAGTSTKLIKHYSQWVASHEFQRYDYGANINQKVYGSEQPPKYDVQNVQAPVTLYYSEEDWLAHPTDVARLEQELPNVKESYKVTNEHFNNLDFQFSTKATEIVNRRLIESMQNYQ